MRGDRSSGRRIVRRGAAALLCALLAPVGLAHLAQNTVPMTRAGVVEVPIHLASPTSLALDDAKVNVAHDGSYQFTNMKATLTGPSGPVAGATITFRVAGALVCTATTKPTGEAICSSDEQFDRGLFQPVGAEPLTYSYTATFAGSPPLQGSTATGALQKQTGADAHGG